MLPVDRTVKAAVTAMARQHARDMRERAARLRKLRIERARTALIALKPGEWDDVMQNFCRFCGGPPECYCRRDD